MNDSDKPEKYLKKKKSWEVGMGMTLSFQSFIPKNTKD